MLRPSSAFAGVLLAAALVHPLLARAVTPSIHLHWNDCSPGPTASTLATFGCNDDAAVYYLVASFVPDELITHLVGVEAAIDMASSDGGPLPDWWRFESGGCRFGSIYAEPRYAPPRACPIPWGQGVSGGWVFNNLLGDPRFGRLRVVLAVPETQAFAPVAGTEYSAFRVVIDTQHTTGADGPACSGCDRNMCIALSSMTLTQPVGVGDEKIVGSDAGVSWGCPTHSEVISDQTATYLYSCQLLNCPTPARGHTWGQIKSLYR